MKKITKLLLFIMTFFIGLLKIEARSINVNSDSSIDNVKIHVKIGAKEDNIELKKLINTSDSTLYYNLTPFEDVKSGSYTFDSNRQGIEFKDWTNLVNLAFFGYGYKDRTDLKWYVATQYVLWEYLASEDGEVYFVDEGNQKITLYSEEIAQIKTDFQNKDIYPSFAKESFDEYDYKLKINEELVLTDENGVLEDYNWTKNSSSHELVENHKLHISFSVPTNHLLMMSRNPEHINNPEVYYNGNSIIMCRGRGNFKIVYLYLYSKYPSLTINLKSNSNLPLSGAVYDIFYKEGGYQGTYTTDSEGKIYLDEIYSANYKLIEKSAPKGYKKSDEEIPFSITVDDINININKEAYYKNVVFKKCLRDDEALTLERNAVFELYNADSNEMLTTLATNELGEANISLTFGNYFLKQVSGKLGYNYAEDLSFTIDEDTPDYYYLNLESSKTSGSVTINLLDYLTNNQIEALTKVRIKNLGTNRYFEIDGEDTFTITDGILTINGLPYGTYLLEEIYSEAPTVSTEPIIFNIKTDEEILLNILKEETINTDQSLSSPEVAQESNEKMEVEVPSTGKNSLNILLITLLLGLKMTIWPNISKQH